MGLGDGSRKFGPSLLGMGGLDEQRKAQQKWEEERQYVRNQKRLISLGRRDIREALRSNNPDTYDIAQTLDKRGQLFFGIQKSGDIDAKLTDRLRRKDEVVSGVTGGTQGARRDQPEPAGSLAYGKTSSDVGVLPQERQEAQSSNAAGPLTQKINAMTSPRVAFAQTEARKRAEISGRTPNAQSNSGFKNMDQQRAEFAKNAFSVISGQGSAEDQEAMRKKAYERGAELGLSQEQIFDTISGEKDLSPRAVAERSKTRGQEEYEKLYGKSDAPMSPMMQLAMRISGKSSSITPEMSVAARKTDAAYDRSKNAGSEAERIMTQHDIFQQSRIRQQGLDRLARAAYDKEQEPLLGQLKLARQASIEKDLEQLSLDLNRGYFVRAFLDRPAATSEKDNQVLWLNKGLDIDRPLEELRSQLAGLDNKKAPTPGWIKDLSSHIKYDLGEDMQKTAGALSVLEETGIPSDVRRFKKIPSLLQRILDYPDHM